MANEILATGDVNLSNLIFDYGKATTGGANTLTDTAKNWDVNKLIGYVIRIVAGKGAGQIRVITANTQTDITVGTAWNVVPDATSKYAIYITAIKDAPTVYNIGSVVIPIGTPSAIIVGDNPNRKSILLRLRDGNLSVVYIIDLDTGQIMPLYLGESITITSREAIFGRNEAVFFDATIDYLEETYI
jgi:hypothetical protein